MWRLPENSIVIRSLEGLGNRLTALEGAILLGREINKKVYLSWPRNDRLNCSFHKLFEKSEEFEVLFIPVKLEPLGMRRSVINIRNRLDNQIRKARNLIHTLYNRMISPHFYKFDVELRPHGDRAQSPDPLSSVGGEALSELASKKWILVNTYYRFFPGHPNSSEPYNYVRPTVALRMRVEEITKQFKGRVVGIHIRRSDINLQRNQNRYVHVEWYIEAMREEIARDPSVRFFLSTEHQVDREHLKNLFGDRLITQPDVKDGRNNAEGIKSAVVDMFALAKTDLIVTCKSSFSSLAMRIGGGVERRLLESTYTEMINGATR